MQKKISNVHSEKNLSSVTFPLAINTAKVSLRELIKLYLKRAHEIEVYLQKNPDEWGKFQNEFNAELNNIFRNTLEFEKINSAKGNKEKVEKLKSFFTRHFQIIFARGKYCNWSIKKPFGYAGDFKIIDDIYQNNPQTAGFDRLFDNYFQMSAISIAVRNRKEDFKRILVDFMRRNQNKDVKIMNLGCGSCREIYELSAFYKDLFKKATFDCYDNDLRALDYAKVLLRRSRQVNFFKINAVRTALAKDIYSLISKKYDLIYSTGLFDYFSYKAAIRLVGNFRKLLRSGGVMAVSSVRDKYSNPSVHFMEWAGEWYLIYRNEEEFKDIFLKAGFSSSQIKLVYEQQGIMQYVIASNVAR